MQLQLNTLKDEFTEEKKSVIIKYAVFGVILTKKWLQIQQ